MTVVVFEYNGAAYFKKVHTRNCSFKDFIQNSASQMRDCIIVDIVNFLVLLLENS